MFQENGDFTAADGLQRGVQYPFLVNEKVVIKVNIFGFTFSIFWQLIYPNSQRNQEQPISTGQQENTRKICWERSCDYISVSQWLVSYQGWIC